MVTARRALLMPHCRLVLLPSTTTTMLLLVMVALGPPLPAARAEPSSVVVSNPCSQSSGTILLENRVGIETGVRCGEERPKGEFKEAPRNKLYTLLMLDPDAPNHTQGEFWLHWILMNVPGQKLIESLYEDDFALSGATYHPPGPPRNTGFHRYIFLLLEQKHKIDPLPSIPQRHHFSLEGFLQTIRSNIVGSPVAANMFKAEY